MKGKAGWGAGFQPQRPGPASTDCVVLASSPEAAEASHLLQLRVQGKEKHQTLQVSLSRVSGRWLSAPSPFLCLLSRQLAEDGFLLVLICWRHCPPRCGFPRILDGGKSPSFNFPPLLLAASALVSCLLPGKMERTFGQ